MYIETDRFILRKVEKNDKEYIFNILSNPNVITNLNMKKPNDITDVEKLIEDYLEENKKGNKYPFAITDKVTNRFLGVFLIKLDLYDDDCYECTVYIDEKEWGKGIYTEVLPYMLKFAFTEIKTGNFRAFVMEKNKASQRGLEKTGFKLEKIFKIDGIEGNIYSYLMKNDSSTIN